MFQRKRVIFQIEKNNKIISEFNENITIFYLKIYIRDRTNIKNFDLYFKGNKIKNHNLPLFKFSRYKNDDKSIKFKLKRKIENEIDKLKSNNNNNINIFTNKNKKNHEQLKLYEKEIFSVKEKNNQLINNINKYKENINEFLIKENKYKEEYNSIENLLLKQKEEIKLLKDEINEANIKYKDLKHKSLEKEISIKKKQLQYTKSTDSFAIIQKNVKPKRCFSVESFNTFYPIQKDLKKNHVIKSINLTSENIKKERSSINSININSYLDKTNSNNQLKISTNNISNIKGNNNNSKKEFNIVSINKNYSRNEKLKNRNINNNKEILHSSYITDGKKPNEYKFQIKEYNTNVLDNNKITTNIINEVIVDKPIIKEEDTIDFNKIINEFKLNNKNKQLLSRENLQSQDSLKLPTIYDSYFAIFNYLNNNEILTFSFINKSNGVCSLYYWINYLENKIIYLNDNYNKLATRYNSLLENINKVDSKSDIIFSNFSKSGLRVLNSPHYLDIFNNPIEYFTKNNIFLFIYKMLFQFIKLYDYDNKNISDNDFISFMENEIKEKTAIKKSLREYIYNLLDKEMDFSFENVCKAKNIMKYYNIETIEGNQLAKLDRASAIIGYVIRDIMGFTGLSIKAKTTGRKSNTIVPKNNNNKIEEDSFNGLKKNIIDVCDMINNEKNKSENNIKKIKELILKYYNL